MLLVSTSPRGALASHSSIVSVDLGCGERIFKVGVLERLPAMAWILHRRGDVDLGGPNNELCKDLILSQQPNLKIHPDP